jgi:poly-beta-1,6-N-acetyl-D-glucosamine N-deacetylase
MSGIIFIRLCLILAIAGIAPLVPSTAKAAALDDEDSSSAVILSYNRIGEEYMPDSSLQSKQFKEQIAILLGRKYKILSLDTILKAYETKQALPQKAIAITFEGGYKSQLTNAIPLLLSKNIPFTVFYAADQADSNTKDFMNWDDLKKLRAHKNVTLGILPPAYTTLLGKTALEIQSQLNKAKIKHREVFGEDPPYFSYPFGTYNTEIKSLIKDYNFRAAFGLNATIATKNVDNLAIPRFSITDESGDMDHFSTIINALPIPLSELEPQEMILNTPTPSIGFSIPAALEKHTADLQCFASDQSKPSIEILGKTRVELRLQAPITQYKTHINCIIPLKSQDSNGEEKTYWRWMGMLLIYPKAQHDDH